MKVPVVYATVKAREQAAVVAPGVVVENRIAEAIKERSFQGRDSQGSLLVNCDGFQAAVRPSKSRVTGRPCWDVLEVLPAPARTPA